MDGFPFNLNTIITLLMTIGGTGFFLRSVWQLLTALESRSWSRTQGIVRMSTVQEDLDGEGILYKARVSYRFTVDGREFVGNRACFGDSDRSSWSLLARRIVARYRVGAAVTVHYDPEKPSEAVLEPGISGVLMARMALEAAFLAMAIWMLRAAVHASV